MLPAPPSSSKADEPMPTTLPAELSKTEAGVCGAIAGGASRCLTAPLDVLKIRFQLQVGSIATATDRQRLAYRTVAGSLRKVAREEGLIGLWRGNLAATYLWIGYGAVQFPVYEALKAEIHTSSLMANTFVAGGGAGLVATVVTYPFDVIRTQFAAQGLPRAYTTMLSFVQATLKAQGVQGLFAGLVPTALQIIPRMGLSFALFEKMDATGPEHPPGGETTRLGELQRWCLSALYGGLSGGIARVVVHPLDTVKRRMQAQVLVSSCSYGETPRFRSSWDCVRHLVRHEGVAALYKGLVPTLLKSILSTAIIFAVYEGLKGQLLLAAAAGGERTRTRTSAQIDSK